MTLKVTALVVAALAVSTFYLHEYHRDKITDLMQIPIFKRSFSSLHNLIIEVSHKLSLSEPQFDSTGEGEKLFSKEEISNYNGEKNSPGIFLSILGKVFDVSKGKKHYGPGGSYHGFAGRDASRAFVTGDFSESGLTDDVMGLTPQDLKSIQDWSLFYLKEYSYKGKLVGRYYTSDGKRTDYHKEVENLINLAVEESAAKNADFQRYPPCNVEWSAETGSRVWCSKQSGGIERYWEGVPRKYFKPGSNSHRCACIELTDELKEFPSKGRKGNLEEYEHCPSDSVECYVHD